MNRNILAAGSCNLASPRMEIVDPVLRILVFLPGAFLLFGMFSLPAGYQSWKQGLLAIVLSLIALNTMRIQRLFINLKVLLFFVFFLIVGLLFTVLGVANGNPGALPVGKEYVLYVIIYMLLIMGVHQYAYIRYIDKVLIAATLFVSFYAIVTVMVALGLIPRNWYVDLYAGSGMQGVDISKNYASVDLPSLPSLLFLQPYLGTRIVLSKSRNSSITWFAFLVGTLVMLLAGRRALILIALLVPILMALVVLARDKVVGPPIFRLMKLVAIVVIGAIGILSVLQTFGYDVFEYTGVFFDGFSQSTRGGEVRITQFFALMERWSDSMFLGYGLGAIHPGLVRSGEELWNFELSYVKMLFDIGIVGVIIYAGGIFIVYLVSIRIARTDHAFSSYLLPMIVGNAAFLIGNATNPYLLKFDYLSVVFLPIALINYWRLRIFPQLPVVVPFDRQASMNKRQS